MKTTVLALVAIFSVNFELNAQVQDKMEDYSTIATQWLLDAVGDTGKVAIKSVYMIFGTKTQLKGSGFLLKGGPIITNEHVIHGSDPADIVAISSQGAQYRVKSVTVDGPRDLAALVPVQQLSDGLLLGDETTAEVGHIVCTWGFPLGYNGPAPLLSVGYLSGFKAYKRSQQGTDLVKHLVVNGAFNSGNSGGPLFKSNSDKVIGVVVSKALPLFTPFVKSAVDAFANNPSGVIFQGTDDKGKQIQMSESQVVAEVVKSLRDMSQVMIGEAISVSELRLFLRENKIPEPR